MPADPKRGNPGSEKSRGDKPRSDLKGKVTYPPDFHREFPQAPDAEKGVLSSILLAPKEVIGLAVESGVKKESFYIPAHGEIFEVLLELWNADRKAVLFVTHDLEEAISLSDRVFVITAGPGTVKSTYKVDLPRPRNVAEIRFQPRFAEIYEEIWKDLKDEVLVSYERQKRSGAA